MIFKGQIVQDERVVVNTVKIAILIEESGKWFGEFKGEDPGILMLEEDARYQIQFKDGRRLGIEVRMISASGRVRFDGMGRLRRPAGQTG